MEIYIYSFYFFYSYVYIYIVCVLYRAIAKQHANHSGVRLKCRCKLMRGHCKFLDQQRALAIYNDIFHFFDLYIFIFTY